MEVMTSLLERPVFLSHSADDKPAVRLIADHLRRTGWTVWIDEAGIEGGKDFSGELMKALEESWIVVLVVSLDSMRSKWVAREVQAADRLGKQILPVVIEETPYPDPLRMILQGVHQLRLDGLNDRERRNRQLARLDETLVNAAHRKRGTTPGGAQVKLGNSIRFVGIAGIVIGFALFVYLGITESGRPSSGEGIPPPFIGFGIFFISMMIAAIGEGIRRAGIRKGI